MDHERIAQDIEFAVGDAASDVAYDMDMNMGWGYSDEWILAIEEAKKEGVRDVKGWFADWLYNNPDFLQDLIGDRVYDKCKGNPEDALKILEAMKEHAHPGLITACNKMIKNWNMR
jgi:hypothetical protein